MTEMMSFGGAEMLGFITIGLSLGAGFFYPLAVAMLIRKAFQGE